MQTSSKKKEAIERLFVDRTMREISSRPCANLTKKKKIKLLE